MKRKNNRNNGRRPSPFPVPIIPLIFLGAVITGIAFGAGKTVNFLKHSDFFKIKTVTTCGFKEVDLSYLAGRNIFAVNLRNLASSLKVRYPQFKLSGVWRVFPDRVHANLIKRAAVFQIKSYRYLYIDDEGVILPRELDLPDNSVPLLTGVERKINPRYGFSCGDLPEFKCALKVIREIGRYPELDNLVIDDVDVSELKNLYFSISPYGLKVRTGADDIPGRIKLLAFLIKRIKTDFQNIEYIDLRFSEPVVKPKTTEDSN